ncbi:MAG: hypothetical protein ACFB9M_00670 [Myxococcota bacterium]
MPDLAGVWAQLQVTTSVVDVPFKGRAETELRSLALLEVQQDHRELSIRETICSLQSQGPTPIIQTAYPPRFRDALSGHERSAVLTYDGGAWRYTEPKSYRTNGARLRDPPGERLPEEPEDPRVLDADHDGKPGLTVLVRGWVEGEVYLVQRGWSELSGIVRSGRQIEGQVAWASEQRVLDATSRLLTRAPKARPHPQDGRSFFRMARVPRRATCAELLPRADRIFGTTGLARL